MHHTTAFFVVLSVVSLCIVAVQAGVMYDLYDVVSPDFGVKDGRYCNVDVDCMNSGKCDKDGVCVCLPGFRNDLSRSIGNCSLLACANNGTLNDRGSCDCPPGWEGPSCTSKSILIH
jgi:hypothetical protein